MTSTGTDTAAAGHGSATGKVEQAAIEQAATRLADAEAGRRPCPPVRDLIGRDDVAAAYAEMALTAHRVLGLRDLSRTDIIVRDGEPYFLEVNVAPGMTETSTLPLAIEAAEESFGSVCSALVAGARARVGGTESA